MFFQPIEKFGIAQHAVFQDLGIAGTHFAIRQGRQGIQIRQHERGLVKGAHQILACRGVDGRLAAYRAIDLCQQRCGYLDEPAAALQDRTCKTGEVAHDAAAKRDNVIAAFDALSEQPIGQAFQLLPALGGFSGGNVVPCGGFAHLRQRRFDRRAPMAARIGVGDDRHRVLAQQGSGMLRKVRQQGMADMDVVAAPGERYGYYSHWRSASTMRITVWWCGPRSVSTRIGAWE